ncbi:MAG: DUF86 domain-containing protein [Phycisphaerales bacterium]
MSRHERLRLLDILDAIDRIESYVVGLTYEDFLADRKTQDAVARNIEIIGEATRALSEEFKDRHADIPWSEIVAMRNIIVHQYFGILPDVVWDVIKNELPALRLRIAEL